MLIPEISITEFRKLKASQINEMKSLAVISDGEVLFYAIIPPKDGGMSVTDNIKTQAEYLGQRGNTVGGKNPEEVLDALRI